MKKEVCLAVLGISALLTATPAFAVDGGSPQEAEEMMRRAVALVKAEGPEKAYAAIVDKNDTRFHDRDLYVNVFDMGGNCVAHGFLAGMIGVNAMELQDADGRFFIRDRVATAKAGRPFSYNVKFMSPLTKRIEANTQYCDVVDNTSICVGSFRY